LQLYHERLYSLCTQGNPSTKKQEPLFQEVRNDSMAKNIEVELKFQLYHLEELETFVQNLKFICEKPVVDVYFDTEQGDLYKRGIFIRIRDNSTLDFKFNEGDMKKSGKPEEIPNHLYCEEYSYPLPLRQEDMKSVNTVLRLLQLHEIQEASLDALCKSNGFAQSVIIEKKRRTYKDSRDFKIMIDSVKNLGEFLEIEKMISDTNTENADNIVREMKQSLEGLTLKPITTGYNELYWRKYNFDLYLQGLFLFEEDCSKYRENNSIKA